MAARFTDEPLFDVQRALALAVEATAPGGRVQFEALDPDACEPRFDGELVEVAGQRCRYRSLAAWVALAEALGASLGLPERGAPPFARFTLRKLDLSASWHRTGLPAGHPEKYGAGSEFARTDKFEDPAFLKAWLDALAFLRLPEGARVLSIGCASGGALGLFGRLYRPEALAGMRLVGVDHSASAIATARARYPQPAFDFRVGDLTDLDALGLGRFDLVIAINVLHSPALPGRTLFRRLVAEHLTPTGGVLLGWPNCRYVDHALMYGAVTRHAAHPEYSVLYSDVAYHRRYLHQHRFRTELTGKNTVLLAGKRLPPKTRPATPEGAPASHARPLRGSHESD